MQAESDEITHKYVRFIKMSSFGTHVLYVKFENQHLHFECYIVISKTDIQITNTRACVHY